MRKEKGIALITLIVTIIVVVIVTAVSMNMLMDEDTGLISKTREAKENYEITTDAEAEEIESMKEVLTARKKGNSKKNTVDNSQNKQEEKPKGTIKFSDSSTLVEIENKKEELKKYYGKKVDSSFFTSNEGTDWEWELFYDDENYIFLISSDFVKASTLKISSGNLVKKSGVSELYNAGFCSNTGYGDGVLSSNAKIAPVTNNRLTSKYLTWVDSNPDNLNQYNMKAVAFMMDTSKWSQYAGTKYSSAEAIGGPTLELFMDSWNAVSEHADKKLTLNGFNSNGYEIPKNGEKVGSLGTSESLWIKDVNHTHSYGYWLASPSAATGETSYNGKGHIMRISADGTVNKDKLSGASRSFRPVVSILKSDIQPILDPNR